MAETRLRDALDLLDGGRKWTKRRAFSRDYWAEKAQECAIDYRPVTVVVVARCSWGALASAWAEDCSDNLDSSVLTEMVNDEACLAHIIREQYPERTHPHQDTLVITFFNDHKDTTWDDVRLVFEKAAIQAEEDVGADPLL